MMRVYLKRYFKAKEGLEVLDVGSYDVNGTYKDLIPSTWTYTGVDIEPGPNVDIVMRGQYRIPMPNKYYDLVISGSCFEHVANPFKLMAEVRRVTKNGGLIIMCAPFRAPEHRHPVDCWRILSDGWRSLCSESGIEVIHTSYHSNDSWVVGRVPYGS
jgi:SAM-dependent methyltransferase